MDAEQQHELAVAGVDAPRPKANHVPYATYRRAAAFLLGLLGAAALVPACMALAPWSSWNPILIGVFIALSLIGLAQGVVLRRDASHLFDMTAAVWLVALVTLGPVPAVLIVIPSVLCYRASVGALLANVAAMGWPIIAAFGVLQLGGVSVGLAVTTSATAYLVIFAAGLVYVTANYLMITLLIDVLRDGKSLRALVRSEYVPEVPVFAGVTLLGTATVVGYLYFGIPALAAFAGIVVVPQLLLPVLLRPKPVGELSIPQATRLYSDAIARELTLPVTMRATLAYAAEQIEGPRSQCSGRDYKEWNSVTYFNIDPEDVFSDVVEAVLYHREHYDASDGIGGIGGELIPLSSRILAVAELWAERTTGDGWTVTHERALQLMRTEAGSRLDPKIVAAAERIVEYEQMGLTDNQPEVAVSEFPAFGRMVKRALRQAFANPQASDARAHR